jgi:hypothetical protein
LHEQCHEFAALDIQVQVLDDQRLAVVALLNIRESDVGFFRINHNPWHALGER